MTSSQWGPDIFESTNDVILLNTWNGLKGIWCFLHVKAEREPSSAAQTNAFCQHLISTALQLASVVWKLLVVFQIPGSVQLHSEAAKIPFPLIWGHPQWVVVRIDNTRGNRGGRRENSVQDSHGLALGAQLSEFKLPRCKAGAVERKKEQVQKE